MKPIQNELKEWMKTNKNFKENYLQIQQEVLNDPDVKQFVLEENLISKDISKNLMKFHEFKTQSKRCKDCPSLEGCINILPGYTPNLEMNNGEARLAYEKCPRQLVYEKDRKQQGLVQSLYMPKEILEANLKNLDATTERDKAITKAIDFIEEFEKTRKLPSKGIYFHGQFGVGKTYILGVIANELKKYNVSSTLIYMPEFVREIKGSFKDDTFNEKVEFFKKADILMIDDIGAEVQSAWFRDEVLGSVLQYRMMEKLPVFFTSNYNLDELETQMASTKSGVEKVKAGRITERIRQVSHITEVNGHNRRNHADG